MSRLVVRSDRVVLPDGERAAAVEIRDGIISAIQPRDQEWPPDTPIRDGGRCAVLPGLVDTHVHINEPGRSHWEGFETATRAAAAGGVTTLVDMPLNSIPATTTVAALEEKRRAAAGKCHVDVAFWGGVVPGNAGELEPLTNAGVLGFKCFMSPSGVEEFTHVGEADLRHALPILARLGLPLLVHAEEPAELREPIGDPHAYYTWLLSRPPAAELAAIERLVQLASDYDARIHIVHLASADALPTLDAARARGLAISVESCPHYLSFAAEDIGRGSTAHKCAPPIRERRHREALWAALADRRIDLVATDHSPAPPAIKGLESGDFLAAWGGIASLQLGLRAVWTEASNRGVPLAQIADFMAAAPARLAGLAERKGRIAVGCDGDIVVFDPDDSSMVIAHALYHRHPVTPYHGRHLRGRVISTLLRGDLVFDQGNLVGPPSGRLIHRSAN